jgi:hypothetical protein
MQVVGALVLSLLFPGSAVIGLDNAHFYLGSASDKLSRECPSTVGQELQQAYLLSAELKRQFDPNRARELLEMVEELSEEMAFNSCDQDGSIELVDQASAALNELLATTPAKAHECWNEKDVGCASTKDGQLPMSKSAFSALIASLETQSPQLDAMKEVFLSAIRIHHVTSMQVAALVAIFSAAQLDEVSMVGVVQTAGLKVVDPEHLASVMASLRPESAAAWALAHLAASMRAPIRVADL